MTCTTCTIHLARTLPHKGTLYWSDYVVFSLINLDLHDVLATDEATSSGPAHYQTWSFIPILETTMFIFSCKASFKTIHSKLACLGK